MRHIPHFRFAVLLLLLLAACSSTESAVPYTDIPAAGDVARGETLFNTVIASMPSCVSCHTAGNVATPDLTGYGAIAGERVAGESAREYSFYSIVEPGRFIVEGYGNAMYNQYDENLSAQDIADLIAYMLTL